MQFLLGRVLLYPDSLPKTLLVDGGDLPDVVVW